jgi:hypothetical protein
VDDAAGAARVAPRKRDADKGGDADGLVHDRGAAPADEPADAPADGDDAADDADDDRTSPPNPGRRKGRAGDDKDASFFVVRLLLPEGDKRLSEVGRSKVGLGSGLDELGLAGDPRVRPSEAFLFVRDGELWVEPAATCQGIYVRVSGEQTLEHGDVVLMGEVAATFERVEPQAPVDPDVMAVGGGANSACGRLVFLRKDGSAGPCHDLPAGKTLLGRTDGHLNFPNDSRLSRRHVRFFASDEKVTVEDLDSRNGTYIRVSKRRTLEVGDALRIGSAGLQVRSRD